jgi:ATP-binding cassette subfamily G (WHITE) protein 2
MESYRRLLSFFQRIGHRKYSSNWLPQFFVLLKRSWVLLIRDHAAMLARLAQVLIYSIFLGLLWMNTGRNTMDDRDVVGVLFYMIVNQSFGAAFATVFSYPLERSIVLRERTSRTYRVSAYFLAKSLAELPPLVLLEILYCNIVYWMVGLKPQASSFFIFMLILLLCSHAAESLTLMASASAQSPKTAAAVTAILIVLSLLFAGFFIQPAVMPVWLAWIRFASFVFYAFGAIMSNQYGAVPSTNSSSSPMMIYQVNSFGIGGNIGFLILLDIIYRCIAYVGLRLNKKRFYKAISKK